MLIRKTVDVDEVHTIKIGDQFIDKISKDVYLLAQTESHRCALISISDGNRFCNPINVSNSYDISEDELRTMAGGRNRPLDLYYKRGAETYVMVWR